MGRKRTPGLFKRGDIWHIDKWVWKDRIRESTGADQLEEAEKYLARRLETIRQAKVYGVRPSRPFGLAAAKFLLENQHKKSIRKDEGNLKLLDPFIGDLSLEAIHMGALQTFIEARRKDGVKNRTINTALEVVRHILNLAAGEWMDEHGLTWLSAAPKIKLLPIKDARKPHPISWEEQDKLFAELPLHLREMALFTVNTGCRDQETCKLRWEWEFDVPIPEINSVFIVPGEFTKNGEDRLIVLNNIARAVVERRRGKDSTFVFTYRGRAIHHMLNNGWKEARIKAGLPNVRVHDLRHTFGSRLRAAGVSFEDRQDLLSHKSMRITTHYSSAELLKLWEAVSKLGVGQQRPILTLLRMRNSPAPTKFPTGDFRSFQNGL